MAEIPARMAHLERDRRGFPIPHAVYRDTSGRPHFTINDEQKRRECIGGDLCPICGGRLQRGRWFVGGPQSAFHEHGAYIDPPMHAECVRYALQTCPYLAAPRYSRRVDDRTLVEDQRPMILVDPTQDPDRPEMFVAVLSRGTRVIDGGRYVVPVRPYINVEFWRHGAKLDTRKAREELGL